MLQRQLVRGDADRAAGFLQRRNVAHSLPAVSHQCSRPGGRISLITHQLRRLVCLTRSIVFASFAIACISACAVVSI